MLGVNTVNRQLSKTPVHHVTIVIPANTNCQKESIVNRFKLDGFDMEQRNSGRRNNNKRP